MKLKIEITEEDTLQSLFAKCGGLGLEHHDDLENIVNNKKPDFNIENGTIKLGEDLKFDFQLLGTLSLKNKKWYWAWDNQDIGFLEKIVEDSKKVKEIGEKYNISHFKENIFQASLYEAHIIAMTTTGLFEDDGYYVMDFEGVLFFITIKSDKIPHEKTVERFLYNYNTFCREFDVNPRLALEGYGKLNDYKYKRRDEFSVVVIGQSRIIVGFNEKGSITHIQTMLEN
ncbi:MAG: hypothetical protein LBB45_07330 [Methanobrevibacter sp.]|jgi:hypothetical protein|nr:hypothetical protein [Candidatus Methanovirga basalitermitum]